MNIFTNIKQALVAIAISAISISSASATIIWDYSPDTTGGDGQHAWSNTSGGQNFLELVTFGSSGTITGMDIFSGSSFGSLGDSVDIKIFSDNAGTLGAILTTFNETISSLDTVGATTVDDITRKYANLTNGYNYSAGSFWIGMSGINQLGQMGLSINAPGNGGMWQLSGNTPSFFASTIGDMAFRLHGEVRDVPEPAPLALLGFGLVGLGLMRKRKA